MSMLDALEQIQAIARREGCVKAGALGRMKLSRHWLWVFGTELTRVGRGVYFPSGVKPDRLVVLVAKYPRLVVGLGTALWLLGAIKERPEHDWIVLGLRDRKPDWEPNARYVRTTWLIDATVTRVRQGVTVRLQEPARAAVDCIRFRRRLGADCVERWLTESLASGVVQVDAMRALAAGTRLKEPVEQVLRTLHSPPARRGNEAEASLREQSHSREAALEALGPWLLDSADELLRALRRPQQEPQPADDQRRADDEPAEERPAGERSTDVERISEHHAGDDEADGSGDEERETDATVPGERV